MVLHGRYEGRWNAYRAVARAGLIALTVAVGLAPHAIGQPNNPQPQGQGAEAENAQGNSRAPAGQPPRASDHSNCTNNETKPQPQSLSVEEHLIRFAWRALRDPIAIFTLALFVIGGIQVDISRRSARRQLRAYVGINRLDLEMPNIDKKGYEIPDVITGPFIYKDLLIIDLRNYGQTPAYDVQWYVNWVPVTPFGSRLPDYFPYDDYGLDVEGVRGYIIEPGRENITRTRIDKLKFFRDAIKQETSLYIFGHVDYSDIYNRRWHRTFSYMYEPWRPDGDRFHPDRRHNEEVQI